MKHKSKTKAPTKPPKRRLAKAAPRKKALTPEAIGAAVRAQLAPAIAPLGVVNNTVQFLNRIERFASMIAVWGPKINLTAHPQDPDEIVFHIFDSIIPLSLAVSAKVLRLDRAHRFLDIGSGAGFPGLVIAAAINGHVTLVEARRKRATFLTEAAIEMGLQNVRVECVRAESFDVRDGFEVITSRAVGVTPEIFKIAGQGLHLGGILMLYVSADQKFDEALEAAARSAGFSDGVLGVYDLRHGRAVFNRAVATWKRL